MEMKSFKKIGGAAILVAAISTFGFGEPGFQINQFTYENFNISLIGDSANFRAKLINRKFDDNVKTLMKEFNLNDSQKEEIVLMKQFLLSEDYKHNLKDDFFFDDEREIGLQMFFELVRNPNFKNAELLTVLAKDGWSLSPMYKAEEPSMFKKLEQGKFGFIQTQKGLQSYSEEKDSLNYFANYNNKESIDNLSAMPNKNKKSKYSI